MRLKTNQFCWRITEHFSQAKNAHSLEPFSEMHDKANTQLHQKQIELKVPSACCDFQDFLA